MSSFPSHRNIRLGVLVPSSNTALEPLTQSIIHSLSFPNTTITVHFSRFRVTKISLSESALAQFRFEPIIAAAQLLADAQVSVIGWSGTSGGWLGFEHDEKLCAEIEKATGVKATTSTLGLNRALTNFGVEKLGLVTPYLAEVNDKIIANYATIGIQMDKANERHLNIVENHEIGLVGEDRVGEMIGDVCRKSAAQLQAVTTFCTNFRAAHRAAQWEAKYGVLILDTVSTVVWDMLRMVDIPTKGKGMEKWGRLFNDPSVQPMYREGRPV